ncbi:hypothetical protein L611_001200000800 [Aminobacter sp. J15]|nr:hypothetical protein L611_001200000800 [Aminobacter sp. J15]
MVMNSSWSLKSYSVNPTTNLVATAEWRIDFTDDQYPGIMIPHTGITPVPGDIPADQATPESVLAAVQAFMVPQLPTIQAYVGDQIAWEYQRQNATETVDLRTPEEKRELMPSLSRAQILLTLFTEERITEAQIDAAIEAIPDETQREISRINWKSRTNYQRTHPMISQIGTIFGLTEERIDELWLLAKDV